MKTIMKGLLISTIVLSQAAPGALGILGVQAASAEGQSEVSESSDELPSILRSIAAPAGGGIQLNAKFTEEEIALQTQAFSANWDAAPTNMRGEKWGGHTIRWYLDDTNTIHLGDGVWGPKTNTDFRSKSSTSKYKIQVDVATSGADFTLAFSATRGIDEMRSFIITDIVNLEYIDFTKATTLDGTFEYVDADLSKYDLSNLVGPTVTSMNSTFFNNLTPTINTSNWNTENVTNFRRAFAQNNPGTANSLANIDSSKIVTKNATNISGIFMNSSLLTQESVDAVANWDVSKVTDFSDAFKAVKRELPVSAWNTSNGEKFESMFEATGMTTMDLSGWDMSKAVNIDRMFAQSMKLTSLDVSTWNVSNVKSSKETFAETRELPSLDVQKWRLDKTTTTSGMFRDMYKARSISTSGWTLPSVTDTSSMFANDSVLASFDVSGFNMSKVTTIASMFKGTKAVVNIPTGNWSLPVVENMNDTFNGTSAQYIQVGNWNPVNAKTMNNMFQDTKSASDIDVSRWVVTKLESANNIFKGSQASMVNMSKWDAHPTQFMAAFEKSNANKVDLSGIHFDRTTAINMLFSEAGYLTDINVDLNNLPEVRQAKRLFYRTAATVGSFATPDTVHIENLSAPKVTSIESMFEGAPLRLNLDLNWNLPAVTIADSVFKDSQLKGLHITKLVAPNITSAHHMFYNNPDTTGSLGLENGPTFEKTTDMNSMFARLGNDEINLSNFHPKAAVNMTSMFSEYKGKELNLENFDNPATTNTTGLLQGSNIENVYFPATFHPGTSNDNILPSAAWRNRDKSGQRSGGTDFGALWTADRAGWWTSESAVNLVGVTPTIDEEVKFGEMKPVDMEVTVDSSGDNSLILNGKLNSTDSKLKVIVGNNNLTPGSSVGVGTLSFKDGTTSKKVNMSVGADSKTTQPGESVSGSIEWTISPLTQ